MREIKFRAWDKENKQMVNWEKLYPMPFCLMERIGPLMQFTGLLDKNGKEIYEGDMVTFRPEPGSCGIVGAINGENAMTRIVVWLEDDAQWGWELPSGNRNQTGYSFCKKCESVFEVIGNVHENPELLN